MDQLTVREQNVLLSILVMLIYFTVDNHFDLYPWNNLKEAGSQLGSTLMGWVPFSALALGVIKKNRMVGYFGFAWAAIWLLLQVRQWWVPYWFGPTIVHADFSWYYEHGYTTTQSLLPKLSDRPTPDLQHMVLQGLSFIVLMTFWDHCRGVEARRG